MDKYQSALIEYAKTKRALAECNKAISLELENSWKAAEATWPVLPGQYYPVPPKEWGDLGGKNLWLHQAYECEATRYDGIMYFYHDDDIEGFLVEKCKYALSAHKLIGKRKSLRYEHGIAKRRLTMMGNKLLVNIDNSEG